MVYTGTPIVVLSYNVRIILKYNILSAIGKDLPVASSFANCAPELNYIYGANAFKRPPIAILVLSTSRKAVELKHVWYTDKDSLGFFQFNMSGNVA